MTPSKPTPGTGAPAPMLDPTWTPERGYSHALELLKILEKSSAQTLDKVPQGG